MITSGRGKYKVWLSSHKIGDDLVFFLGGGEYAHIGAVVIAKPGEPPQVCTFEGHRDDVVLRPIAQRACEKYRTTVVVLGGVHIDQASKKDIDILVRNCGRLLKDV